MSQTVELPIWLLVVVVAFAAVTALNQVLVPSARWFLRRRMERVVARLNSRLVRPIEPLKLARRTDMIQRLIYDPEVAHAVAAHASETGVREDVAFESARRYAREIVPGFSATLYFGIATRLARWLTNRLYSVELGERDPSGLNGIDPDATLVYVINHRSNMDYVLMTYLVADRSAVAYAVGEWARVWPLRSLIRAMGGYFIRRRSRNALYRRVLARYVQLATEGGVTQAIFPEGGLSLDGTVGEAKLGLLSYLVDHVRGGGRDVVFVPVSLGYDKVIEDRLLLEAGQNDPPRFRSSAPAAIRFASRWIWRRLRGDVQDFGMAAVVFGRPLRLERFLEGREGDATESLGAEIMDRLRSGVPILPVPLVSTVFEQAAGPITGAEITQRARDLVDRAQRRGVSVHLHDDDPGRAVEEALRLMALRHMIERSDDGHWQVRSTAQPLVAFYARSIAHHVAAGAQSTAQAWAEAHP